jgi:hypothetical protein
MIGTRGRLVILVHKLDRYTLGTGSIKSKRKGMKNQHLD